jgi:quinoprotein glucose dehydrogenase
LKRTWAALIKHNAVTAGFILILTLPGHAKLSAQNVSWPAYGGADGDHYSRLVQINRANVDRLRQTWVFDTGEKGDIQANPVIIGRTLYAYTSSLKVIALDAATGRLKWKFDSGIASTQPGRGVAYWTDGKDERIFAGIMNYLYCLDARTGIPIPGFGENGRIDLRKGLREPWQQQSIALTTPGSIYKDLIIVGGRDPEVHPAPPGDIRAFDVHTGALRWVFHTIPRPGQPGYDTWPPDAWKNAGAANDWSGMTVDAQRGIVFVPTGSAVMDFYGGDRIGDDLYANCILALDAATGKLLWYFQGVHHDLWDRDFPAPPALYTLLKNGHSIPALAQITKQTYVYLFNRVTGAPLFPIHEHPFPPSTVPGEKTSPTQPVPDGPAPFGRQQLTAGMLTNRTPEAHAWAVDQFSKLRSNGQFYPFAVGRQTVVLPGFDGGGEWSGPAVDPVTSTLFVGSTEMAWLGGLIPVTSGASPGEAIYQQQCAICHGINRAGAPPTFPSLIDVEQRLGKAKIIDQIQHGTGRMPAFPNLDDAKIVALLDYLRAPVGASNPAAAASSVPGYTFTGYRKFLDPDGYPAIAPPWGTLNALDLKTGKYLWQIPLGEYPELAARGLNDTGSELYGGPIVTAGGVLFIGATVYDRKFHAFDTRNGKLLWETVLPFAGIATPSTYMVGGRQYVVIAASGGRDPKGPVGGEYIAFALPRYKKNQRHVAPH